MLHYIIITLVLLAAMPLVYIVNHSTLSDRIRFVQSVQDAYYHHSPTHSLNHITLSPSLNVSLPHTTAIPSATHPNPLEAFLNHPYYSAPSDLSIEEYMLYLSKRSACHHKPIFATMARVSSDLYWQLIENYFYTMYQFGHLDCAVMICMSDPGCMQRCAAQHFPCFDYTYENPNAVTFEMVAAVKLRHVGNALDMGVNIMLLDLDVGFLQDPLILYEGFIEDDTIQVRAQMDLGYAMDKFRGNTWFNFPRSNFGLYIVKAHPLSSKVFHRSWRLYTNLTDQRKSLVASDQSVVIGAMAWASWKFGYNFSYFYLGFLPDTAPRPVIYDKMVLLLDKVEFHLPGGLTAELGGELAQQYIGNAVAVHATCYEKSSKLLGLKAVNAFWNSEYYNPTKRTLIKPLMVTASVYELLHEIRALAYVAMLTNRSLIIPNLLIGAGREVKSPNTRQFTEQDKHALHKELSAFNDRSRLGRRFAELSLTKIGVPKIRGDYYWPGFRIAYANILEPSFYYRLTEHYKYAVPDPSVLRWSGSNINDLVDAVDENDNMRVVLDISAADTGRPIDIEAFAKSSVSDWGGQPYIIKNGYTYMPKVEDGRDKALQKKIKDQLKLCTSFLIPPRGNRTCFNKCM